MCFIMLGHSLLRSFQVYVVCLLISDAGRCHGLQCELKDYPRPDTSSGWGSCS